MALGKSLFEAEMRRYNQQQVVSSLSCSLTQSQLKTPIEQQGRKYQMRRQSDHQAKPAKKRLFIFRPWFIMMLLSIASVTYAIKTEQLTTIKNINNNVKTTTGIDMLSPQTYKNLAAAPAHAQDSYMYIPPAAANPTPADTPHTPRVYSTNPELIKHDMHHIEEEVRKLEQMAKDFDAQFAQ